MKKYLFIAFSLLVFLFPISAIITRGSDAINGATWGYKSILCNSPFEFLKRNCNIDWKNIKINFGVYDPNGNFDSVNTISIVHEFIKWNEYEKGELDNFFNEASKNNRWTMVTVEPFTFDGSVDQTSTLFEDILKGSYDEATDAVCLDFKDSLNPVFIRWGHEMENVTGRYPWAKEDSESYIASYRYFVNRCRQIDSKNYFVWSPVGHTNANNYWPGGNYVDLIGLSVFEYPQWDIDNYGKARSFDNIFADRYNMVKDYDKSVIIAEFGVTGNQDFQKNWLFDAINSSKKYPLLKTIFYFNSVDSEGVWGDNYATPDWKINPDLFKNTN